MKKFTFFLILLIALSTPLRVQAQNTNWVALESDSKILTAPGQPISVMLNSSLNTAINGAAFILRYDPACFKITSHQAGSLLPDATAFAQEQPGQLDLTYYFQGNGLGLTGEGSLIIMKLETLRLCASDLSAAPETISLGVLDEKGLAFSLPGVEYRSLVIHLAPSEAPAVIGVSIIPAVADNSILKKTNNTYFVLLLFIILTSLGAIIYFLLRRRSKKPSKLSSTPTTVPAGKNPALIHAGRLIPLLQQRTLLGRHTEIIQRDGGSYLTDTGSRKGTFLNGDHLGQGYYLLQDGDQVQLGREVSYSFVEPKET